MFASYHHFAYHSKNISDYYDTFTFVVKFDKTSEDHSSIVLFCAKTFGGILKLYSKGFFCVSIILES